jgi:signal transduction histidine kinase/CheY-like chemotaxis protein
MRPMTKHRSSAGIASETTPIACTLETLFHLAAQLEEAARACGADQSISVGQLPPVWPSATSPTGRFWLGSDLVLALVAEAPTPKDGERLTPHVEVRLAVTPDGVRELAHHVIADRLAEADSESEAAVRRLSERDDLPETSAWAASRALLGLAQALDREHAAIREQERAALEIRSRLEQVERNRAHAAIARALGHHFHNRLEVIQARADLAALRHTDDETQRCAQEIAAACRSCCDTLVRLESYTSRRPVNSGAHYPADEAIGQTFARLAQFLDAYRAVQPEGLEVITDLDCETPLHLAREDLHATIEALVVNAVEAMPEGGQLAIRSRSEDGWAVIEVTDSGMGMSEEVAKRVFHPFYTTKGGTRTGLSLGQVHALVVENGGSIDLTTKEGEGSTFTVRLPGFFSEQSATPTPTRMAAHGAILVIEDEDDVRTALVELLEYMGYAVAGASGGHVAEAMIEEQPIGLVLTDLGVPDLTAFTLARRLRKASFEAPIVLLTGWGHDLDPAAASEAGIDLVLTKPISARSLGAALEALGMVGAPLSRGRSDG